MKSPYQPIPNSKRLSAPFNLTLPAHFFTDEGNDELTYSVTLADGSPLPDWISFDPIDRKIVISATAPSIESVTLTVIATDENNASATETLVLLLEPVTAAASALVDPLALQGSTESPVGNTAPTENGNKIEAAPNGQPPTLPPALEPLVNSQPSDETTAVKLDPVEPATTIPVAYKSAQSTRFDTPAPTAADNQPQRTLPADVIQPLAKLFLVDPLEYKNTYSSLVSTLDTQRSAEQEQQIKLQRVIATSIAATPGLTVGYIAWVLRGGILLASVLSSLPAWRIIDPLPILNKMRDEEDTDDESLESIVDSIK